jgi:hypothetical protein
VNRRAVATGAVIVLAAVLVLALAPRRQSAGQAAAGRDGTLALQRVLRSVGVQTSAANDPPSPPGTFLLLSDFRDRTQAASLLRWASEGGHLVVADPQSAVFGLLHAQAAVRAGGLGTATTLPPRCVAPSAVGVRGVEVASGDPAISTDLAAAVTCFPVQDGEAGFELDVPRGTGTITLLGGPSPLTNAHLSAADNAAFAVGLLGPGPVVFGPPIPPGAVAKGQTSIWEALPLGARGAIIGLGLAAVAFALSRGRRLGAPVLEDPIAPIPAGELVHATAGLYRRGHHAAFAGRLLRRETTSMLARRMGWPGADPQRVVAALEARQPGSGERARRVLLGPDPATDDELMQLARELEDLRRSVEVVPR